MIAKLEKYFQDVMKRGGWKTPLILGLVAMALLILLDSVLFVLILSLLKLVLFVAALLFFIYAGYLGYPLVVAWLKKEQEKTKTS